MSDLLCERCEKPALVIYEHEPLCGACAVEALDDHQHYLVVQVDNRASHDGKDAPAESSTQS